MSFVFLPTNSTNLKGDMPCDALSPSLIRLKSFCFFTMQMMTNRLDQGGCLIFMNDTSDWRGSCQEFLAAFSHRFRFPWLHSSYRFETMKESLICLTFALYGKPQYHSGTTSFFIKMSIYNHHFEEISGKEKKKKRIVLNFLQKPQLFSLYLPFFLLVFLFWVQVFITFFTSFFQADPNHTHSAWFSEK